MSEFLDYFKGQQQAMLDLLVEMIHYETFTKEKAMVDKLGAFVEDQFHRLGASSVTTFAQTQVGDFKLARWNEDAPGKPIMFLIHVDTVWPIGTLERLPVRYDDEGRIFGPGAVDMKGGITVVLTALRGLNELNQMPNRPIWVLMTSDEEVGSAYSETLIKDTAKDAGLALVMEPGTKEGALKMWRKGIANYDMMIEGRASHAGNAPEQGINSIIEFAQQALRINELNDLKNGTSVSVTVVNGGSASNVIPARTTARIDTRMMTVRAMDDIDKALTSLEPFIPGAKVTVECEHSRPPMEFNAIMQGAFNQAKSIGEQIGLTVRADGSGGGSDGNFTAAMGIPTIDGMGPQGDGLHADHEQVVIRSLPERAALVAGILRDWVMPE